MVPNLTGFVVKRCATFHMAAYCRLPELVTRRGMPAICGAVELKASLIVASPEPYRRAVGSFACVPRVRARPGRLAVLVLLPDRARDRLQAAPLDSPAAHP